MSYARVRSRAPLALRLSAALLCALGSCPAGAKPAAPKAPPPVTHSKNVRPVTVVSVDEQAVHLTLADGTALDAELRPSSLFLKGGVAVRPTDFGAGTRAIIRTRTRASDGAVSVVLLSDAATAAAIDAYRRKPLAGRVKSQDDKYWVIKPEGAADATPLTLHVTAKTAYRKNGAGADATAFPVGSSVTVITRGLPSGLLMASVISDSTADAAKTQAALKPVILSGAAAEVQPDKGLLTIVPRSKPRQTIAVTDATRIKIRKEGATFGDVKIGMRVTARLSHEKDSAGHLIATSLSVYDESVTPLKKPRPKKAP